MVLGAATPQAMDGFAAGLLPCPATRQDSLYCGGALNGMMPRLRLPDDCLQAEGRGEEETMGLPAEAATQPVGPSSCTFHGEAENDGGRFRTAEKDSREAVSKTMTG